MREHVFKGCAVVLAVVLLALTISTFANAYQQCNAPCQWTWKLTRSYWGYRYTLTCDCASYRNNYRPDSSPYLPSPSYSDVNRYTRRTCYRVCNRYGCRLYCP